MLLGVGRSLPERTADRNPTVGARRRAAPGSRAHLPKNRRGSPLWLRKKRQVLERIGATVTETPGSHAVYVSNPAVVAGLITQAARSALRETTAVA